MAQGDSMPLVGTVKSLATDGLPATSTSGQFGKAVANGPNNNPALCIAAKFSPLIQIRSTAPFRSLPAALSATTRATASAVDASLTCPSVTP